MNRFIFFFLSPLVYSIDGDPYRAFEIVFVCLLISFLLLRRFVFKIAVLDILAVVSFSGFLILQQFYIYNGNLLLGIKFFVTTIATFLPFWLLRSVHWRHLNLELAFVRGIRILFWLATIMIVLSFVTGIGERYPGGIAGYRAFGYLGDSFSAVMVFLLMFFALEGSKFHVGISIILILMMGAKSAILFAIFCFALYSLFVAQSLKYKIFGLALTGCLLLMPLAIGMIASTLPNFEHSFANRLISYQLGIQYFMESPIFGIGINQGLERASFDAIDLARSEGIDRYYPVYQVQNAYLRTLSETGLIGLSLMMLLVYFWVINAIRSIKLAKTLSKSSDRSMILAGALWVIGFVSVYQTTGWFVAGHTQLTWLIMFSTLSLVFADRKRVVG